MSYAQDLDVVARTLAVLGVHGSHELTEGDLDIALVARGSVLELATAVQFDLTGLRGRHGTPTGAQLEAHPAAAFAQALNRYPSVRGRDAPSDALGRDADTDAGAAWQRVARHALSATQHWRAGGNPPSDDVAWAGLADIAAICAVVTELDAELARRVDQFPGREDVSALLAHATTSGLCIAARQVSEVASSGPLPDRGPEPRALDNRGPVTITAPSDVITAHRQLDNLLASAEHIRPERMTVMVIGHLRTVRAVLNAWPDHASDDREALVRHERLLTEVTRHPLQAAAIDPGDTRALRQAQIIRQACTDGSPLLRQIAADPDHLAQLASTLAQTTVALQDATERMAASGAWLTTKPEAAELRWMRLRGWRAPPPFVTALRTAAVQANRLKAHAVRPAKHGEPAKPVVKPAHARDLLRPAPFRPLDPSRTPLRPTSPSLPVRHPYRR